MECVTKLRGEEESTSPPKKAKIERDDDYPESKEGTYTAVLIVEDIKLYILKELLVKSSPVFEAMFSGNWNESHTKEVPLPDKSYRDIVLLLEYVYHQKYFKITRDRAIVLLPLAVEYAIKELQKLCENTFRKSPESRRRMYALQPVGFGSTAVPAKPPNHQYSSDTPTLHMLTTAEILDLKDLREAMINRCARRLSMADLELQKGSSDNDQLRPETYTEVVRMRLRYFERFVGSRWFESDELLTDDDNNTIFEYKNIKSKSTAHY